MNMRPQGQLFDGSASLFETQECLVNSVGHALWLTHFTPARREHLAFVNLLLKELLGLTLLISQVSGVLIMLTNLE